MAYQNPNQFSMPADQLKSNQVQPETTKNDTQSVSTPPTYPSGIPPSQNQNTWSPNQQYYPPNQQYYPPNQQYYPPNQQYYPPINEQTGSKQNPSPSISTTLLVFGILGAIFYSLMNGILLVYYIILKLNHAIFHGIWKVFFYFILSFIMSILVCVFSRRTKFIMSVILAVAGCVLFVLPVLLAITSGFTAIWQTALMAVFHLLFGILFSVKAAKLRRFSKQ